MPNKIPDQISRFCAKRPLVTGEDSRFYDEVLDLVVEEENPQSHREWTLVLDIAVAEWELLRLHAMKAEMVSAGMPEAMEKKIAADYLAGQNWEFVLPISTTALRDFDCSTIKIARDLLHRFIGGDEGMRIQLDAQLAKLRLTFGSLVATAFDKNIASQVQVERMLGNAEKRRNNAYATLNALRSKRAAQQAQSDKSQGNGIQRRGSIGSQKSSTTADEMPSSMSSSKV